MVCTLLLAFQNCSPVQFQTLNIETDSSNNNGGFYGGKPETLYQHYVPGFSCETQPTAWKTLSFFDNQNVFAIENTNDLCSARNNPVQYLDIDRSSFQNEVIGWRESIFERSKELKPMTPSRLVEAWCFDENLKKSEELILSFDPQLGGVRGQWFELLNSTTTTQPIFVGGESSGSPSQAPISRWIGENEARYESSYLKVSIQKDVSNVIPFVQPTTKTLTRFFPGQLEIKNADGQTKTHKLACRLGGLLDSKVWPAQQLGAWPQSQIAYLNSQKSLPDAFIAIQSNPDGKSSLISIDVDTKLTKALTSIAPAFSGVSTTGFNVDPVNQKIIYTYAERANDIFRLFSINFDGTAPTPLSASVEIAQQNPRDDTLVIPEEKVVLYKDGEQEVSGDVEGWLRVARVDGQSSARLVHSPLMGLDAEVGGFAYSKYLKSVIYGIDSGVTHSREIWMTPLSIVKEKQVSLPLQNDELMGYYGTQKIILAGEQGTILIYATTLFNSSQSSPMKIIYRLHFVDLTNFSHSFIDDRFLLNFDPKYPSRLLLGRALGMSTEVHYFDLDTKIDINLGEAAIHSVQYNVDSLFYTTQNESIEIKKFNLKTKQITALCPPLAASSWSSLRIINESPTGAVGALGVLVDSHVDIYKLDTVSGCKRVNSLPIGSKFLDQPSKASLTVSSKVDQAFLLGRVSEDMGDDLVWIPFDGRQPVKINTPLDKDFSVRSPFFSSDNKNIFFQSELGDSSLFYLYVWKIPSRN